METKSERDEENGSPEKKDPLVAKTPLLAAMLKTAEVPRKRSNEKIDNSDYSEG